MIVSPLSGSCYRSRRKTNKLSPTPRRKADAAQGQVKVGSAKLSVGQIFREVSGWRSNYGFGEHWFEHPNIEAFN